ncbi:MAG: TetR/AcrR family transcriptional regulator [Actinomycetota bacterium]
MSRRNEAVGLTRQRIVDAAVELHGSVGPAATTIAAIAETAGVTRLTVYRHFPDTDSIFAACSAHWMSQQIAPRPDVWAKIGDPLERLRCGLTDLYRFYRDAEQMLTLVRRDVEHVPAPIKAATIAREQGMRDVLLSAFRVRGPKRDRVGAVIGHALSFSTWRSLCVEQHLSQPVAVDAMVKLVEAVAAPAPRRRTA